MPTVTIIYDARSREPLGACAPLDLQGVLDAVRSENPGRTLAYLGVEMQAPAVAAVVCLSGERWEVKWADGQGMTEHGADANDPMRAHAASRVATDLWQGLSVDNGHFTYPSKAQAEKAAAVASKAARIWAADHR